MASYAIASLPAAYFSGTGGVGTETDAIALAALNAIVANNGDLVAPGNGVLATDTQQAFVNTTGSSIPITATTASGLLAAGLTPPSTTTSIDVEAVTTIAQMTTIGDLYELTVDDGPATAGLYVVRANGTPTQVQAF